MEFNLGKDVKGKKKGLYSYISNKRKMRGNMGPPLHGARDLMKKSIKKAEILSAFSTLVFTGMVCFQ